MAMYAFCPREFTLGVLFAALVGVGVIEFLRLRRPELNAWLLGKFGGIHRSHEVTQPSGIFWALLGCWLTMFVFTNRRIVLPALGFLSFGDAAAALGGQRWGKRHWKGSPEKTYEGSACFAGVSALWALWFLPWPVAVLGALIGAWLESRRLPWNDNVWLPLMSGLILSVLNLTIGRL